MRITALTLIACPVCGNALKLGGGRPEDDGHVMTGILRCAGCARGYPIRKGVPRLVSETTGVATAETAARFGAQWKTFTHMAPYQEEWLKNWLAPLGPSDYRDKIVLEGGCGKGRHTVVVASWGAKAILALDLSESVDVAFAHTRALPSVHVVQGDILAAPTRKQFDIAYSIGVLHHLPDPRAGFTALSARVRSGGKIAIWVYGCESNEWIVKLVNPLRVRVTSRIAPGLLFWLSLPPSVGLVAMLSLYRRPGLRARLPYREYLTQIARLPAREVHNIVFDQLVTPIAHYLSEGEVRSWFAGLKDVTIAWHNRNSWRGSATVT